MRDSDSKETGWVKVAPGVAFQVEWGSSEYRMAATGGGEEVQGRLTGQVSLTRDAAFDAQWGVSLTDDNEEG